MRTENTGHLTRKPARLAPKKTKNEIHATLRTKRTQRNKTTPRQYRTTNQQKPKLAHQKQTKKVIQLKNRINFSLYKQISTFALNLAQGLQNPYQIIFPLTDIGR
jgi:hypothetical protein